MKNRLRSKLLLPILLVAIVFLVLTSCKSRNTETSLQFRQWLFEYIPMNYPDAKMIDHGGWLQGYITEETVANWTQWNEQDVTLKHLEAHALTNGKTIFIEKAAKTNWVDHPAVTYFENAGYYIDGYDSETMSTWGVENCNVIQFDGDGRAFTEKMAEEWAKVKGKK